MAACGHEKKKLQALQWTSCVSSRRTQVFFIGSMTISAVWNSRTLIHTAFAFPKTQPASFSCRFLQHVVVCSRMSEERFSTLLSSSEIDDILRSAQNVNTQKATSLWLRAVTSFRQEKNVDISFGTCSKKELDQFLCQFYTSLRPKKPGVEYSGRLTSGSRLCQAVPSPFCQRSKDERKLRPKFTKCEKINIFEHVTGFRPPVAMAKPKWRQILLSLTIFSNVTEGKPLSCACSVFLPVKRMGVCNFSPMG